ncbi:hypothetical protein CES85_3012 (plasmid) [Ochrobactrum quorumnocens]|uniref:Uncharacterized protein n=1 Tax=Ochrobactrum quorumnocens TaxID=271865 RepID=A0A248UNE5_9HYPH|nr:hypothetical protein CES85_3012 [[Ochrobactrum] quorumnocens]
MVRHAQMLWMLLFAVMTKRGQCCNSHKHWERRRSMRYYAGLDGAP